MPGKQVRGQGPFFADSCSLANSDTIETEGTNNSTCCEETVFLKNKCDKPSKVSLNNKD